jgi:hypothetical protein
MIGSRTLRQHNRKPTILHVKTGLAPFEGAAL